MLPLFLCTTLQGKGKKFNLMIYSGFRQFFLLFSTVHLRFHNNLVPWLRAC